MTFRQLSSGITVVLEPMPHFRSISLGVWVNAGSIFETDANAGVSHFIEHMLFKGTERRSAVDISMETDAIGANLNAFTAKECTCFHIKALDEDMPLCVDILSDIVLHSRLDPTELEREKGVILEEIAMNRDFPEDLVFEKAAEAFYAGMPLSREILGTEGTVARLRDKDLREYMAVHYTAENIVIAAAGSFEEERLIAELERAFAGVAHGARQPVPTYEPQHKVSFSFTEKDAEQVHTVLLFPGAALASEESFTLAVLSNILGGSMSSRLFRHIREERGLCYSVYSYPTTYRGIGSLGIYVASTEKQAEDALRLIFAELDDLLENGVSEEELVRYRQQLKGSYVLGMETASAHMNTIGKTALLMGTAYDAEKTLQRIESVTREQVLERIPKTFLRDRFTLASVGRLGALKKRLQKQAEEWSGNNGSR